MSPDQSDSISGLCTLALARMHAEKFTSDFLERWLPENLHVWTAFELEAMHVIRAGFKHYSARTILHVLRHHSALQEKGGQGWKINDHVSPYLARLFDLMNPEHAGLFEFREAKAAKRERGAVVRVAETV